MADHSPILSRREQIAVHCRTILRAGLVILRSIAGIVRALTW